MDHLLYRSAWGTPKPLVEVGRIELLAQIPKTVLYQSLYNPPLGKIEPFESCGTCTTGSPDSVSDITGTVSYLLSSSSRACTTRGSTQP